MAHKFGAVAMIGKPNVGKSTLLNEIVGQKVSIVSNKPQTTRRRALGIATADTYQIAFFDTPGIHDPHTRLGRLMVEEARSALQDIDLVLYVADVAHHPNEQDKQIAKQIVGQESAGKGQEPPTAPRVPILLALNKMDLLKAENVQAHVDAYCALFQTDQYMLTTAVRGNNVERLVEMIVERLPEGEAMYPEDEFTNQPMRFLVAEMIREKILQATRQEIPHATGVKVLEWTDEPTITRIEAEIIVEKASQRAILIGKGGDFIKRIGTEAREEIQQMVERKVFLELHVRVREDWRMNPRMLHEMEYADE